MTVVEFDGELSIVSVVDSDAEIDEVWLDPGFDVDDTCVDALLAVTLVVDSLIDGFVVTDCMEVTLLREIDVLKWHLGPLVPSGQSQVKPFIASRQTPPLTQESD